MKLTAPRGVSLLFSPRENVDTDTMLRVMAGLQRCSMSFIPVVQKLCGRCKPPLRFFIPVMSMSHVFLFLSHSSRSPHTSLGILRQCGLCAAAAVSPPVFTSPCIPSVPMCRLAPPKRRRAGAIVSTSVFLRSLPQPDGCR